MFLELHMLQNFVPSNLNRDDTNAPKDCEFGGYRRARISSQCLKRAIRQEFAVRRLLPQEQLAVRTKRLVGELVARLVDAGRPEQDALLVAEAALGGLGLGLDAKRPDQTQYLLFVGQGEIDRLVQACLHYWEPLLATRGEKKSKGQAKEAAKAFGSELKNVLDGGRAADLALFGRMLADIPDRNVDASSQVAHAISTHRVGTEFDFYTAVDDLQPETTSGAGMMGTVEFNSACFYRYENVNLHQLARNLGGDEDLGRGALRAFLRASIDAVPTGKQNSMAAHNPPSLVFVVLRDRGLQNLANAFVQPVRPRGDSNLVEQSMEALDTYWRKLTGMYGVEGIDGTWLAATDAEQVQHLTSDGPAPVASLIDSALETARFGN